MSIASRLKTRSDSTRSGCSTLAGRNRAYRKPWSRIIVHPSRTSASRRGRRYASRIHLRSAGSHTRRMGCSCSLCLSPVEEDGEKIYSSRKLQVRTPGMMGVAESGLKRFAWVCLSLGTLLVHSAANWSLPMYAGCTMPLSVVSHTSLYLNHDIP